MARRRRARENPGAGFWIAVGVGVVAVGGVAYVMTRPAAAATTPALPPHPTNDAATYSPQAAAAAAANAAGNAASQSAGGTPVTLSYTVNGRTITSSYTPNPNAVASDMANAITAASAGHGAGKEGEAWKARAVADGASQAQIAQLQSYGYSV
jgi:hypothetical protein